MHFLPFDSHPYFCVSGGKKCYFFGKFGVCTERMKWSPETFSNLIKKFLLVDASNPHHHLYMDVDHYRKLYLTIIHRNMLRV